MGFNSHTLVERTRKRCTNFSCNDELTLTSPRQILYEKSYITICASWKVKPKFFKVVIWNPCQSSLFLTILVRLWFSIISLVFFYVSKILFSGFLQFKSSLVCGQNNSSYFKSGLRCPKVRVTFGNSRKATPIVCIAIHCNREVLLAQHCEGKTDLR